MGYYKNNWWFFQGHETTQLSEDGPIDLHAWYAEPVGYEGSDILFSDPCPTAAAAEAWARAWEDEHQDNPADLEP